MKNLKILTATLFVLTATAVNAQATSNAGAASGSDASATSNMNVDGSVGVGAVGGANGCAVGGGIGIPGVAGLTVTYSEESCVTNNEAEAIARFCGAGANTAPCHHLWMNNPKIERSLRAAGMIVDPSASAGVTSSGQYGDGKIEDQMSTRTMAAATQAADMPTSVRVALSDGTFGEYSDAAQIEQLLSALQAGRTIRLTDGRMVDEIVSMN